MTHIHSGPSPACVNAKEASVILRNVVSIGLFILFVLSIECVKLYVHSKLPYLSNISIYDLIVPHRAPVYRLVAFIVFLLAVILIPYHLMKTLYDSKKVDWWLPKVWHPKRSVKWSDIFSQISLDSTDDPLVRHAEPSWRPLSLVEWLAWPAVFCIAAGCLAIALDYIVNPHVPGLLIFKYDGHEPLTQPEINIGTFVQVQTNLTAYLAIITALIAIYVARFTIRAQVRSKSRQEWIDKVRKITAQLISDVDLKFRGQIPNVARMNERKLHLELLLNPSEKDHRLLTMLFRICTGGNEISDDKYISKKFEELLGEQHCYIKQMAILDSNLYKIVVNRHVSPNQQDDAISYIVRLSNIILKREWMRVRETR